MHCTVLHVLKQATGRGKSLGECTAELLTAGSSHAAGGRDKSPGERTAELLAVGFVVRGRRQGRETGARSSDLLHLSSQVWCHLLYVYMYL